MPRAIMAGQTSGSGAASTALASPPDWANPATVGLSAFGLTTILAGLAVGNWIASGPVFAMALAWGGSTQLVAGIIALRKGEIFAGSAFTGYGAFWWAYGLMLLLLPTIGGYSLNLYGVAAFMFVWMLWTLTFLVSAPKHGIGVFLVFLFLFIAFILLTVLFYELASGVHIATATMQGIGAEIILDGAIAWFVALAIQTNANYGRRLIPV
jgi:succinate-acetate transporter protein